MHAQSEMRIDWMRGKALVLTGSKSEGFQVNADATSDLRAKRSEGSATPV